MPKRPLRCGYTTGACAAAAAHGAALMFSRQQLAHESVITLPDNTDAAFALHGQAVTPGSAVCFVIKDAGDDPDVTNGAEVWAEVVIPLSSESVSAPGDIEIIGGAGIGRVTKPGLALPPGEWAINPVPRAMIKQAVRNILPTGPVRVTISIPDGAERAKRTLNERLGIVGGLSILGTTGIVRPVSAKAWTDTIDAALDVARACGCLNVVFSTGRTSELAAQRHVNHPHHDSDLTDNCDEEAGANRQKSSYGLPEEAFVMMGDHISHTVRAAVQRGFCEPLIACQFAKLLKIACGHANTHAAASELDLSRLREWTREEKLSKSVHDAAEGAHTAREAVLACDFSTELLVMVARRAEQAIALHAPGIRCRFLVCGYDGRPAWLSE